MLCSVFGHKPLLLDALGKGPLITIHDRPGKDLVDVHMCTRCKLLYWEAATGQRVPQPLLLTGPSQPDVGKGVNDEPIWH